MQQSVECLKLRNILTYNYPCNSNVYVLESRGRVLNGERYAQRLQKLFYLDLFTDCFMKISCHSSEGVQTDEWREIFMKLFVNKVSLINFCSRCV